MIFGWFLNNTITSNPGSVKFSVRFFSTTLEKDDANNNTLKLDFSLSTKTQTININPAISYDINDSSGLPEVNQYNDLYLVANRFENSKYLGEAESAAEPVFVPVRGGIFANDEQFFGQFSGEDGTIYHLADLDANGELELSTEAISEDAGKISYYWYEKGFNDPTGHNISGGQNHVLTPDEQVEENNTYYVETLVNGVPSFEEAKDLVVGENFPEGDYYEIFNGIVVKNAGDFWVEARNRHGVASASIKSDIVRVPGPKEITLKTSSATGNFLNENGEISLNAVGTTEQEGDIIKYAWANLTTQESWETESDINAGFDADGETSQNIPNEWSNAENPVAIEEIPYFDQNIEVTVWAERNGLKSKDKKQVMRVTGEPCAPILEVVNNNITVKPSRPAELVINPIFKVNKEDEREFITGDIEYQWFKAVSEEGEEEILENDILLENNDAIQGVNTNKLILKGGVSNPESGVFYCSVTHKLNGGEITVFSDKINVNRY